MDTSAILDIACRLRDKLLSEEVDERWIIGRKALKAVLILATYQKNYDGMKATGNYGYVEFFDSDTLMTEESIKKLKEAKAIDKQMGKILRERRLANNIKTSKNK